jgi:acetylornithine deacetylase/succinyl-diaminopimelate desuccinylase-like protein
MNKLETLFNIVDRSKDELVKLHQDLVRIPTVNTGNMPTGNESEICRYLEKLFSSEGIDNETLESATERGNFLAYLGNSYSPSLLLMSHSDVVPVGAEDNWTYPPFAAQIADGRIYGRGSDDAKSLISSGVMTFLILSRANIKLNGRLIFLAAADEENGGSYGAKWLSENVPEKVRANYAINEGGGNPLLTDMGLAYYLAIGEKGRSVAKIIVHGQPAHAAQPWLGVNAIEKMSEILLRIRDYLPELSTSLEFFPNVKYLLKLKEEINPENVDQVAENLTESYKDVSSTLKALSRMTITPTIISGGTKSNNIPSSCTIVCDVRTLPGQDEHYVEQELRRIIEGWEGVDLVIENTAISSKSPENSDFVKFIKEAMKLSLGRENIHWLYGISRGFTDSRFIRSLGTQVYGFAPITPESNPVRRIHGIDEFMEIENLLLRTKMQIALAYLVLNSRL